jgi:hypothetical protein
MKHRNVRVACVLCLVLGCTIAAFAALPPSALDQLRITAEEAIIIEVTRVTTDKPGPDRQRVRVRAKVLAAERSNAKLAKGDVIDIEYTRFLERIAGPGFPDVLAEDAIVPAFLDRMRDGKTFEPAAHGHSFVMTPTDPQPPSPPKASE